MVKANTMSIDIIERETSVEVAVWGEVSVRNSHHLRTTLLKLIQTGGYNMIAIHTRNISTIDSSGLGVLLACRRAAIESKVGVCLVSLSPAVDQVLKITKLQHMFPIYRNFQSIPAYELGEVVVKPKSLL